MKKRDVSKQFLGFAIPTKKLMKSIQNSFGDNYMYGIVVDAYSGKSRTGRKYFRITLWPEYKTFFYKQDYDVDVGDVVKATYKPKSQSGINLEVL